jgi:hypothetical protein
MEMFVLFDGVTYKYNAMKTIKDDGVITAVMGLISGETTIVIPEDFKEMISAGIQPLNSTDFGSVPICFSFINPAE